MSAAAARASRGARPLRLVLACLAALLVVSAWSRWYASAVSLPRYCEDPAGAVAALERIIAEAEPAGEGPRRPYVVAAKLLFIVPRASDEPAPRYLARVRAHIDTHCG